MPNPADRADLFARRLVPGSAQSRSAHVFRHFSKALLGLACTVAFAVMVLSEPSCGAAPPVTAPSGTDDTKKPVADFQKQLEALKKELENLKKKQSQDHATLSGKLQKQQ